MKEMNELANLIRGWHKEKQITIHGNVNTQFLKLIEEVGELGGALAKQKDEDAKDAIGDIYVVLSSIADLMGYPMEVAVSHAWEEIKDRPGKLLENGNFLKDA